MLESFAGIPAPFFEVGPKAYLYGDDAVALAVAARDASLKHSVAVIYTPQISDIYRASAAAPELYVCAQHIDALPIGRGQGAILPEAVRAAGAKCAMLNHAEKPVSLSVLRASILRAESVGLISIVCADSCAEAAAVARLAPDIIVAEPSELIGTGEASDEMYVKASIEAVKGENTKIQVLQGAGISTPEDVYRVIFAGADATGSSSAVCKAKDPAKILELMLEAARQAYDDRISGKSAKAK